MAYTADQETLVGSIMGDELRRRLELNQTATIATLFDPATPSAAKNFLRNRLLARKATSQASLAELPQRQLDAEASLNADIALIDSVLALLV